jgi:8-amino-7-oxononanoate synthase
MDQVDFFVGTFSKSLGAMGGFCASPHAELELIRYVSRPFIFTASSSPSIVASTHEALQQLKTRPELRETLWRNARRLYEGFSSLGFEVGPEISPVVAVRLGGKEHALLFWNRLLEKGVYTNLMIPPASPDQHSYIRCSVSAAHTEQQVEQIIGTFQESIVKT